VRLASYLQRWRKLQEEKRHIFSSYLHAFKVCNDSSAESYSGFLNVSPRQERQWNCNQQSDAETQSRLHHCGHASLIKVVLQWNENEEVKQVDTVGNLTDQSGHRIDEDGPGVERQADQQQQTNYGRLVKRLADLFFPLRVSLPGRIPKKPSPELKIICLSDWAGPWASSTS
jgi:hypothetical protein